jgi:glycosyltransferase involved in cell wall biosynthesis
VVTVDSVPQRSPAAGQPISIAHVITELDTGGAEIMLARLIEWDTSGRFQHSVISLAGTGAIGTRLTSQNIPVASLHLSGQNPNPSALWRLAQLLRTIQPAIVQTWLYHADLAGLIASALARHRVHVVWNVRCAELNPSDHTVSSRLLLKILPWLSGWPSAVVVNSRAGLRAHQQMGYRPKRWVQIPNGFDVGSFRPDPAARSELRRMLRLDDRTPVVGLLARFHPVKDHATYLRAAASVIADVPNAHFVAAGRDVRNDRLKSTIRELGIEGRVSLLAEQKDAARLLAGLDVAVSSSYSEAFPNAIAEAMACGVPCVVTDVGESRTIVDDTGAVVPPRDSRDLAAAITRLLHLDPASRRNLGTAARSRIVANFSIQSAVERYQDLYLDLLSAGTNTKADSACAV